MRYLVLVLLLAACNSIPAQENMTTVTIASTDDVKVYADWYKIDDDKPVILLCHQAGYSRGEYRETAAWLNDLGFNCMAIDQRSGNKVNGVKNETFAIAEEKGLGTGYLDAEADILAGLDYLYDHYHRPIIIVGSSYSSSLVLKIANGNEKVKAVVSFSPGEYFGDELSIEESVAGMDKTSFLTASKDEATQIQPFADVIGANATMFIPEGQGSHGSKALWTSNKGHEEYREAFKAFLLGLE